MKAVISKIYLTKVSFFQKSTFLGVKKKVRKGTNRSIGPNTGFLGQNKREGGRAETENAGVKKFSSFIWTFVVNKEHGKRKRDGVGKS